MADFRASQEGSGSPSWVTTNEDFCGLGDGKLAGMTHGNPPSPVSNGKLEIGADLARRARP